MYINDESVDFLFINRGLTLLIRPWFITWWQRWTNVIRRLSNEQHCGSVKHRVSCSVTWWTWWQWKPVCWRRKTDNEWPPVTSRSLTAGCLWWAAKWVVLHGSDDRAHGLTCRVEWSHHWRTARQRGSREEHPRVIWLQVIDRSGSSDWLDTDDRSLKLSVSLHLYYLCRACELTEIIMLLLY
jgi:hypothetical protein